MATASDQFHSLVLGTIDTKIGVCTLVGQKIIIKVFLAESCYKTNISRGLIDYELNSLCSPSHLVDCISVNIRFDLERYLVNTNQVAVV